VLWIHQRLGNARSATSTTLARELEVSIRTIKRDIVLMRDLGAPVVWEPATHTYFYDGDCDLLPLLRLDADEALALVLAGQTFSAWRGSPLGRALTGALDKIARVVGGAVSLPADSIESLIFQPADQPLAEVEQRNFAIALNAIQRRRELRLEYRKAHSNQTEPRVVHPLQLAWLDHRWMLIAFDPLRQAPRSFLLTRIHAATPTGGRFRSPAGFDVRRYLQGSLGRFTGDSEHEVRIRFDSVVAPYLREHPWHPSQAITESGHGDVEVTLRLNNLVDVERRVLACGAHAEVLAPRELRDAIRTTAERMHARYA
jgi:predicted DNA-binding transcriptional regulator YafY